MKSSRKKGLRAARMQRWTPTGAPSAGTISASLQSSSWSIRRRPRLQLRRERLTISRLVPVGALEPLETTEEDVMLNEDEGSGMLFAMALQIPRTQFSKLLCIQWPKEPIFLTNLNLGTIKFSSKIEFTPNSMPNFSRNKSRSRYHQFPPQNPNSHQLIFNESNSKNHQRNPHKPQTTN